ncbi:MAG: hypothetical protein JXR46_03180 [Calditrichaceae bacterium]|nr:hypothetical protein [Calditrichaceae bacterium]MBN2708028.1 hypothetical protein [Calditrichaceae bacterium]RQV93969.1 MAG: hypothetical protein EH224_11480 [Calditrichota bacterium]
MPSAGSKNSMIFSLITGTLCSVILGYLFAGKKILVPYNPDFQLLLYGLIGSLLLAILKFRSIKDFLIISIVIFIMELLTYRFSSVGIVSGRVVYMLGMAAALYLFYIYFENSLSGIVIGKFIVLAGLLALIQSVVSLLAWPVLGVHDFREYLLHQSFIGLLLGTGIGLGFELVAWGLKRK